MNRKDKTVKQLQAECKKRKIGFMTNWTKLALIKRLEDEDKREIANKKVEDKVLELRKSEHYVQAIMNSQINMVLTTDGKVMKTANKAFFEFYKLIFCVIVYVWHLGILTE